MFLAVQVICSDLIAVFSALPNFTDLFTLFNGVIKNIKSYSEAQALDYKGKTETKSVLRINLIDQTLEIVRRVVAYATVNNLYELKEKVNYNQSELKRLTDTELRTICQVIHKETTGVLTPLAPFGVTQAMLDDLQHTIDDYFAEITSPREGIISRKNATAALKEEFKKGNQLLWKGMDKLVEIIKTTDVESYKSYKNARIIVDLGKGRKKSQYSIDGLAIDFESGLPLGGVSISVVGTTKVVMTGIDGIFSIPVEGPGEYSVRAERSGCKELIENVTVDGVPTDVALEMEKV
jgi:hypothetical protein